MICPRVSRPLLLSQRKVDWLRSPGSGYGSQKGSSDWYHLNSMMISARATSVAPHLQFLVYAQTSGLMSKLNLDWPEQSAFVDELTNSREGANGLMAVTCIAIAILLIARGLWIKKTHKWIIC